MEDEIPLSQIADVLGGFAFKSEHFVTIGFPVVKIANIEPPHVSLFDCDNIPKDKVVGLDRFVLNDRDIVMAMTGATIGKAGRVRSTTPAYLNQRVARIAAKAGREFDDFVWAIVSQRGFDEEVLNNAGGSAQANVSAEGIGRIPIPNFSPDEQRAIGKVIGTLDDKIELNRRMNRTLEELAAALFRSWFVDFDPVVAKAAGRKPTHLRPEIAALFPATFQDSSLGPIPKGWRVATIGDIADNPRRIVDPTSIETTTPYIGLEHMPRKSICLGEWGTATEASSAKTRFQRGEILFGKLRPYFHKVGIALTSGVCSTDLLVILPKAETWFGVLAGHLSSEEFIDYSDASSGGTRMPRTSWHDMKRYQIVLPTEQLAQELSVWYRRAATMLTHNAGESRTLAALRDTLLPKLLSGELRVKSAEKLVEAKA